MMLINQGLPRRYAIIALLLLCSLWLWVFFGRPYSIPSHAAWDIYSSTIESFSPDKQIELYDNDQLKPEAIQSVCRDIEWTPGLYVTCNWSVGGIGNIRNSMLSCIRYAIEAGGALVMPRIVVRSADDIAKIRTDETADIDYMFDREHFRESLRLSCPQLDLYDALDDIPERESAQEPLELLPESLLEHIPRTGIENPQEWRKAFYTWLEQYTTPDITNPVVIEFTRSYLQYNIHSDGSDFATNFGRILQFRKDIRTLAAIAVKELAAKYSLSIPKTDLIAPNAFFGAHLRTEIDAVKGWPPQDWNYSRYDTQSRLYLDQAARSNTSLIYVASGNATEVERFAHDSRAAGNYTVVTKFDVLRGEHRTKLDALAWDQQGMVDFLVLLRASDFAGIAHSSFAWNIALRRHLYSHVPTFLDGPQMLSDELSQIYGEPRAYPEYAACMWP